MAGGVRNVAHMGRITRQYKHDDISLGVTHRLMVRGIRSKPAWGI